MLFVNFLIYFIIGKLNFKYKETKLNTNENKSSLKTVILKHLALLILIHMFIQIQYFFRKFSKNFYISHKYLFGMGAALSSIIFFFSLGYLSKLLSTQLNNQKSWKAINTFIILFMGSLALYILIEIVINFKSILKLKI